MSSGDAGKEEGNIVQERAGANISPGADFPLASASLDMIRRSRVLLSHTLDAARSY